MILPTMIQQVKFHILSLPEQESRQQLHLIQDLPLKNLRRELLRPILQLLMMKREILQGRTAVP